MPILDPSGRPVSSNRSRPILKTIINRFYIYIPIIALIVAMISLLYQWQVKRLLIEENKPQIFVYNPSLHKMYNASDKWLKELGYTNTSESMPDAVELLVDGNIITYPNPDGYENFGEKIVSLGIASTDSLLLYSYFKPERIAVDSLCIDSTPLGEAGITYEFPMEFGMFMRFSLIGLDPNIHHINLSDNSSDIVRAGRNFQWFLNTDSMAWIPFPWSFHFWSTENQSYDIRVTLHWHDLLNKDQRVTIISDKLQINFPTVLSFHDFINQATRTVKACFSSRDSWLQASALRAYKYLDDTNQYEYFILNKEIIDSDKYAPLPFTATILMSNHDDFLQRMGFNEANNGYYHIDLNFTIKDRIISDNIDYIILDNRIVLVRTHRGGGEGIVTYHTDRNTVTGYLNKFNTEWY